MKKTKASKRYANSLLGLSNERNVLERVKEDMSLVRTVISENKELDLLLQSPIIKAGQKTTILRKIFGSSISELSMAFIELLAKNGREMLLFDIAQEFIEQYRTQKGIITAEVITASPLTNELRQQVISVVKTNQGSQVELEEKVNSALIGGLIVKVGDKQYDASFAHKLDQLKRTLKGNKNS